MKLTKCLIVAISLGISSVAFSSHNDPNKWNFSENQLNLLKKADLKCSKYGIHKGLCSAIVWHESSAGKNLNAGESVGNFHNLIKTVYNREMLWKEIKDKRYSGVTTRAEVKKKLLSSIDYEILHSVAQIKECQNHLRKINKLNYKNVFACYNAGYNFSGKKGQFYAKNVSRKMEHLQAKYNW